jgi:hypothetical protein
MYNIRAKKGGRKEEKENKRHFKPDKKKEFS